MGFKTRRFAMAARTEHEKMVDIHVTPEQAYSLSSKLLLALIRNSALPEKEKSEATQALADCLIQLEGTVLEGIRNMEEPLEWAN